MRARRLTTVAATIATLGGLTLAASPADAQRHTSHDARGDVVKNALNYPRVEAAKLPHRRLGDVTSLRATHGARRVNVAMGHARLDRDAITEGAHLFSLRTSNGPRIGIALEVTDRQVGEAQFFRGDQQATCQGLRGRVDYAHQTVRFSVPRSCLGDPRWVRVGGSTWIITEEGYFIDDAHLDGIPVGSGLTRSIYPEPGPRLRRH